MRTVTRSLLGLCLLTLAGCDAPDARPEQAPLPPAADNFAAGRSSAGQAADVTVAQASSAVRDYGTCYAACFDERTSATNRETCKLNCESVAEAAAEVLGEPAKRDALKAIAGLHGCIDLCHEDATLNATNRETCILTCADAAELKVTPAPAAAL